MTRQQKTLLIASELYYNEHNNELRIMNCNGQSVIFNEESWEVTAENFKTKPINGIASAIIKLKGMERN